MLSRRHAHAQVFGGRVELGLLARAARGVAKATLARTGKPPHLEFPEPPFPAKRVVRHDLALQAHELHLGAHHVAGRDVAQHPPPERVALLVLGSRRGEALELGLDFIKQPPHGQNYIVLWCVGEATITEVFQICTTAWFTLPLFAKSPLPVRCLLVTAFFF